MAPRETTNGNGSGPRAVLSLSSSELTSEATNRMTDDTISISKRGDNSSSVSMTFKKCILTGCCFLMIMTVLGFLAGLGVLFVEIIETFQSTRAMGSLIQSVCTGLVFGTGAVTSPVIKKVGSGSVCVIGGMVAAVGLVASAFAPNLPVLIVAVGVVTGIGLCTMSMVPLILVGEVFDKRRSLALTVVSIGPGVGALVFPVLNSALLDMFGWRGTFLILAGIVLQATPMGLILAVIRREIIAEKDRKMVHNNTNVEASLKIKSDKRHSDSDDYDASGVAVRRNTEIYGYDNVAYSEACDFHLKMSQDFENAASLNTTDSDIDPHTQDKNCDSGPHIHDKNCDSGPHIHDKNCDSGPYIHDKNCDSGPHIHDKNCDSGPHIHDKNCDSGPHIHDKNCDSGLHTQTKNSDSGALNRDRSKSFLLSLHLELFTEISFIALAVNVVLITALFPAISFFLVDMAISKGFDAKTGSFLLSMVGFCNLAGRFLYLFIRPFIRVSQVTIFATLGGLVSLTVLSLVWADTFVLLVVSVVSYGLPFGGVSVSYPSLMFELAGAERYASAVGYAETLSGVGALIGGPIAGSLKDLTDSYDTVVFSATAAGLFCSMLFYAVLIKRRCCENHLNKETICTHM